MELLLSIVQNLYKKKQTHSLDENSLVKYDSVDPSHPDVSHHNSLYTDI